MGQHRECRVRQGPTDQAHPPSVDRELPRRPDDGIRPRTKKMGKDDSPRAGVLKSPDSPADSVPPLWHIRARRRMPRRQYGADPTPSFTGVPLRRGARDQFDFIAASGKRFAQLEGELEQTARGRKLDQCDASQRGDSDPLRSAA